MKGAVPGPNGSLVFVRNAVKAAVNVSDARRRRRAGRQATRARSSSPDAIFGIEPNVAVMHQVVTAQLAAARAGTQSTKTRAEVQGGGAKPWRQKGTGRARQGSIRAPHWRGGGVAHGPKPRDYRQRTPKKMVRLALRRRLSDRAVGVKVLVVDDWGWDAPKTKDAIAALHDARPPRRRASARPRVLLVLDRTDEVAWKSFRNLGDRVQIILPEELNAYDVLVSDWLVFTEATLAATVARLGARRDSTTSAPTARPRTTPPTTRTTRRRRNDHPRPPRHPHPPGRVGEVVRELRRRTSTRSSSRPTPTRSRSSTRSRTIFNVKVTNVNTLNRARQAQAQPPHRHLGQARRPEAGHRVARRGRPHRDLRELTMPIRKRKPTSPGRRFQSASDFAEITKDTPERSLVKPKPRTGGRNAYGRMTARHRGGGHKQQYRVVDFRREQGRRAGQGRRRSSTTRTATRASRCCTTSTARSATSSPRAGVSVGDSLQQRPGLGDPARQRAAAALHPGRHRGAQRRAEAGRRRQDRPAAPGAAIQLVAKEGSFATLRLPSTEMRRVADRLPRHGRLGRQRRGRPRSRSARRAATAGRASARTSAASP